MWHVNKVSGNMLQRETKNTTFEILGLSAATVTAGLTYDLSRFREINVELSPK